MEYLIAQLARLNFRKFFIFGHTKLINTLLTLATNTIQYRIYHNYR